jgi:uncharacterized membrane protein
MREHVGRRLSGWLGEILAPGYDSAWKSRTFLAAIGTLMFFFPFSLLFVAGGLLPAKLDWMSSFIIILSGIATLLSDLRWVSVRTAVARFLLIAGALFIIEFVGVNTWFPFGRYTYTEKLGLLAAGVPMTIAIAWYCTVVNAWRIAEHLTRRAQPGRSIAVAVVGGLMTLGLDIALEPMAGSIQKYWLWEANAAPVQNYVSWFILSTGVIFLLSGSVRRDRGEEVRLATFRVALFLFGYHFVLFVLTILIRGYVIPAAAALILAAGPFVFRSLKMKFPQTDATGR